MDHLQFHTFLPFLAVALDLIIGDPPSFPHPVRLIGFALVKMEEKGHKLFNNPSRLYGASCLVTLCTAVGFIVHFLMMIPVFGVVIAIYLGFSGLALGCLLRETREVVRLIDTGDLNRSRKKLAMLVSRDTSEMDKNELRRSLAETLSENLNDGFTAPLFYLFLFGPVGMWVFKTVSTIDSMWGYRTERFEKIGWAGAKADDILAWIPARITVLMLLLSGAMFGFDWRRAKRNLALDARQCDSPNAGWPMSTSAWLVGATMGGKTKYFGEIKDKPLMGPRGIFWNSSQLNALLSLTTASGLILTLAGQFILIAVYYWDTW